MAATLENGARVGVVGGGPAGSLFAYFLLRFARQLDLDVRVEIFEPRDFTQPGPMGCNMCGGIVSESLVQALAAEGIELPPAIVQRGIDSYVLATALGRVRIETPTHEQRIAAIHRGGGPRDVHEIRWGGLDAHLLGLACELGADVVRQRVGEVGWRNGRPEIRLDTGARSYDLLVGANGVNSSAWQLFESLGLRSTRPTTVRAYITELSLGEEVITRRFGSAMHLFLLDIPRLDCAAIIPKGEFVTVCLLGRDIDRELVRVFFADPVVRRCFPEGFEAREGACHCAPKINVREASMPFMDRVVLVGDCGVTRLYKDGIGAAYQTAKAAARVAIFSGVGAEDFKRDYWPVYRAIARDNRYGMLAFRLVHVTKSLPMLLEAVVRVVAAEQTATRRPRRMSAALWDMFTGSAPYADIARRVSDPRLVARVLWELGRVSGRRAIGQAEVVQDGPLGAR